MFPKKQLMMEQKWQVFPAGLKDANWEEMGHKAILQKGRPPTVPSKCLVDDES